MNSLKCIQTYNKNMKCEKMFHKIFKPLVIRALHKTITSYLFTRRIPKPETNIPNPARRRLVKTRPVPKPEKMKFQNPESRIFTTRPTPIAQSLNFCVALCK